MIQPQFDPLIRNTKHRTSTKPLQYFRSLATHRPSKRRPCQMTTRMAILQSPSRSHSRSLNVTLIIPHRSNEKNAKSPFDRQGASHRSMIENAWPYRGLSPHRHTLQKNLKFRPKVGFGEKRGSWLTKIKIR